MLWDLYQSYRIHQLDRKLDRVQSDAAAQSGARDATFRLEDKVDRLALICRAMFELMQESNGIQEERLKAKIIEIDLRDGQADDRMAPAARKCPKCDATMSPQFGRCLFCGHQDDQASAFR
jgi:hypothetical protein